VPINASHHSTRNDADAILSDSQLDPPGNPPV
jgi:hypothetical protein